MLAGLRQVQSPVNVPDSIIGIGMRLDPKSTNLLVGCVSSQLYFGDNQDVFTDGKDLYLQSRSRISALDLVCHDAVSLI